MKSQDAGSFEPRQLAVANYRSAVADVIDVLELTADVCQAPMAALKVADQGLAHFAATWGIQAAVDVPKSRSLCDMVSTAHDTMVLDDAPHDPRVADHPLVSGAAHVNFIAAAPLYHEGHIVGALCVFDNERRGLDAATTRRYLERLARRVDTETALRHHLRAWSPLSLSARDDVVTTISHELRTPLAAIQGYAEMLAEMPGAHVARAEAIGRNARRLGRTVDTLLRATNQQSHEPIGDPCAIDLTSLIATAAAAFGPAADRLVVEAPARPVSVSGDPRLLEVAIGHLLSNALGFSAPEEPVTVTIHGGVRPSLEVRDRGAGLDATELGELGTPFFRGRDARRREAPGLGLGLSVARRILDAQGAELSFVSPAGGGLTARVLFPAAA
ncbi:GAF domain-containing sensor histidine kinase [Actinoplanes sp. NPDC049596]|uniref:GAF domain-containing sensor histidine kinase n=1 Tax=unclassified Actinoplanes TaxID=2626549 RepID=UPI00343A8F2C